MSDVPAKGQSEDEKDLKEARGRFDICVDYYSHSYQMWREDYRFGHADSDNQAQWPDALLTTRELDQKPTLTVNKTRIHCLQIINDAKQNKPGIVVHPTTNEGTYEAAQVFEDVVRHIEYQSRAQQAYDKAVDHQVYGGKGDCRVYTEYASPDGFDQDIFIGGVKDPLSVFYDPDAKEVDRSDMEYAFEFDDMSIEKFKRDNPGHEDAIASPPFSGAPTYDGWLTDNHIRVANYWRKKHEKVVLVSVIDPNTGERRTARKKDISPELIQQIKAEKARDYRERNSDIVSVQCIKIAGNAIIERYDWLGKYIPLVPCIGEEVLIEGQLDLKGHVRYLKDAQRMYNYNTPLALDTPLPTPTGWTTMGEVAVGDMLLSEAGKPVKVIGLSPVHVHRDCYTVTFDDGTEIVADKDHLWTVEERGKRKAKGWDWSEKVVTTADLTPGKHFIWASKPLDLPARELPIDPYVLGVWLGDGSTAEARISAGMGDAEAMRTALSGRGYEIGVARHYAPSAGTEITVHGLRRQLSQAGLLGNKHIPDAYLRASRDQRLELLRGLMDTDGAVAKTHQCIFVNTNERLVRSFRELLASLGMKSVESLKAGELRRFPNGKDYQTVDAAYVHFAADPEEAIFTLPRKANLQTAPRQTHARRTKRHRIVSVVAAASVPVRCVTVDSAAHLFLAGTGMVPTHNSAEVEFGALQTKIPFQGPAEAFEGYEEYYATANLQNLGFLPYKHRDDQGNEIPMPKRVDPPQMSGVFLKGLEIAQQEMMMASGQYQSQTGENENAKSGKAIAERQRQGDNATYGFVDNQAIMIRQVGRIVVDLIPKILDTKRILRIRGEDGILKNITIDPQARQAVQQRKDAAQQAVDIIFNPTVGEYAVEVDIGPSYATRRQEAWNAIVQILTQSPQLVPIVGDLLFQNADFPGADEIAQRLRRMAPPQALGDAQTPQDQQLQQHVQLLTGLVQQLNQKLSDKSAEQNIRAFEASVKAFDAMSDRLKVIGNAGPIVTRQDEEPLIASTLQGMESQPAPAAPQPVPQQQLMPAPPNAS